MGLDIYLYKYANEHETLRKEKAYEEYSSAARSGKNYDSMTQEEKDDISTREKTFAEELGLDKWGNDKNGKESIELPSAKYPDHYFKIGYFRSSYNDGGINRILGNLGLPDLYKIFNRKDDDEYHFKPDWERALNNTKSVITKLKKKSNLRCFDISWNEFKNPDECEITDERKAMDVFIKEKNTHADSDGYSNINGHFYIKEPIKVYGLVSGVKKLLFNDVKLPCTYYICEGDNEWYIQALEIVQETIEYVLSQSDKDKYILHWSS